MIIKPIINKILILLIFIFIPFFGFLFRLTTNDSLITIIKFFKIIYIYITILIGLIYLSFGLEKFDKNITKYVCLIILFSIPYFTHFFLSKSFSENLNDYAFNELVLLFYFTLIFIILSLVKFDKDCYIFLSVWFVLFGTLLGLLSIWFSINITPERLMDRFVGIFLRSGTEVTDPNLLSAILNISSMSSILLYILSKHQIKKFFAMFTFLIIQIGRFFTFSNGGLFSIIISLLVLSIFLKHEYKHKFMFFLSFVFIIMGSFILYTGMEEIIFYRLNFHDDQIANSSIYSRLEQYENFFKLAINDPTLFLYGTGSAKLPEKLNLPVTLHNSFLRPLGVGGLISFITFLALWFLSLKNYLYVFKNYNYSEMKTITIIFFAAFVGWSFQSATLPYDVSGVNIFFFSISYALRKTMKGMLCA